MCTCRLALFKGGSCGIVTAESCVKLEVLTRGGTMYMGHLTLEVVREPTFLGTRDPNVGGQRNRCREPAAGVGS